MSTYGATNGVGVHATVTRKKEDVVASKAEHEEAEALTLEDRVAILERQVANLTSARTTDSTGGTGADTPSASADASVDVSANASIEVAEEEDLLDDGFEDTK